MEESTDECMISNLLDIAAPANVVPTENSESSAAAAWKQSQVSWWRAVTKMDPPFSSTCFGDVEDVEKQDKGLPAPAPGHGREGCMERLKELGSVAMAVSAQMGGAALAVATSGGGSGTNGNYYSSLPKAKKVIMVGAACNAAGFVLVSAGMTLLILAHRRAAATSVAVGASLVASAFLLLTSTLLL